MLGRRRKQRRLEVIAEAERRAAQRKQDEQRARDAAEQARRDLAEAQAQHVEARSIATSLRALRAENPLAERIQQVLRGEQ